MYVQKQHSLDGTDKNLTPSEMLQINLSHTRVPSTGFRSWLGSQPAGDVSHKPGSRLPLLFARPTVTLAALKRAATNFAAW